MYVGVYKESEFGTHGLKVNSWSPRELLRSEDIAHFVSFKAEFTTTVQESANGRLHIDIRTGMEGHYTDLCVSGNRQAMVVLEAIKNIVASNSSGFGSTDVNLYVTKTRGEFKHPHDTPTLYAVLDSADGDTTAHFKISEIKYFDLISSKERNATKLNIYYKSPFFYSKKMPSNGAYIKEQVTTNIVLSDMGIDAHEVHLAIEKARNTAGDEVIEKQQRIDNF